MRVLMLSWEYPPLVVGGLGRHVEALARHLAAAGHDVRVVTRGDRPEGSTELIDGVRVVRAALDPLAIDFTTESLLAWALAAEHALIRAGLPALRRWRPDVVHAHDWLVAHSALTLAAAGGAPLVATVHATESGRHQGWLPAPLNRAVHSVEHWLAGRADEVIVCSESMRGQVVPLFGLDPARVHVVPNGIDVEPWLVPARRRQATRRRLAPDGPLLAFAGRLVHEKGLQTLLAALPTLRRRHPGLRLVVAGTGGYADDLRAQARSLRLGRALEWTGFVTDTELAELLAAADVAVVPSRYEPFGLVALEAAAARTALVVSATGGLADLAAAGVATAAVEPDDPAALAAAISGLLHDPSARARAVRRSGRVIRRDYTWTAVAAHTAELYRQAAAAGQPTGRR